MNTRFGCRCTLLLTLCCAALACGGKGSSGSNHDSSAEAGRSGSDDNTSSGAGSGSDDATGGGAGSGSGGSSGDSWTNPDFCPEQAPKVADACSEAAESCHYDRQQCACLSGEWACNACPDQAPELAADCEGENTLCQYTERTCMCAGAEWVCLSDDCPDATPTNLEPCPTEGVACAYETASCACITLDPMPPMWICFSSAGCPDQQPANGASCSALMLCEYGEVLCGCPAGLAETGSEPRWSCM
ncbi:MAG: hypothetical protein JW940_16875 [Polyangiaceae bacterium]|nr:hypothetical protein [Polyangiaceae bacterium]